MSFMPVHHERDSSTSPDGSRTHQESLLSCALAHIEQDMCDIVDAPLVQFTASKAPPGHERRVHRTRSRTTIMDVISVIG